MDRNDYLGALPFLVRSFEVDQPDKNIVRLHRERLGAILRSSPKLTRVWPHAARGIEFMVPPAPLPLDSAPEPPAAPSPPPPAYAV